MSTTRTITIAIAIAIGVVGGFGLTGCATPNTITAAQPTATSGVNASRTTRPDPTAIKTPTVVPEDTVIPQANVGAVKNSPAWQAADDMTTDLGLVVDLYTTAAQAGVSDIAKSSVNEGEGMVVADMKRVVGYTEQGAYSLTQSKALATMLTEAGEIATAIDQSSDSEVNAHWQNYLAGAKDFVVAS